MSTQPCPAQQRAFDQLNQVLPLFPVLGLIGGSGAGKTTLLRELQRSTGGEWFSMKELLRAMRTRHPLALEETFEQLIEGAFQNADTVYLDDFHLLAQVVQGGCGAYPRSNFLSAALETITSVAEAAQKKLIFSSFNPSMICKRKAMSPPSRLSRRRITISFAVLTWATIRQGISITASSSISPAISAATI